jgi:hypothetical protein
VIDEVCFVFLGCSRNPQEKNWYGRGERKKKEKGLTIDKVRNISSFLNFLELDCIRV